MNLGLGRFPVKLTYRIWLSVFNLIQFRNHFDVALPYRKSITGGLAQFSTNSEVNYLFVGRSNCPKRRGGRAVPTQEAVLFWLGGLEVRRVRRETDWEVGITWEYDPLVPPSAIRAMTTDWIGIHLAQWFPTCGPRAKSGPPGLKKWPSTS